MSEIPYTLLDALYAYGDVSTWTDDDGVEIDVVEHDGGVARTFRGRPSRPPSTMRRATSSTAIGSARKRPTGCSRTDSTRARSRPSLGSTSGLSLDTSSRRPTRTSASP
jgi:hypothetical protein